MAKCVCNRCGSLYNIGSSCQECYGTRWLLNSAVIPAGCWGRWEYRHATWEELGQAMQEGDVVSRIGYPDTATAIQTATGHRPELSREASPLAPGDVAYVVRLKYRVQDPSRKGRDAPLPDDWEFGFLHFVG